MKIHNVECRLFGGGAFIWITKGCTNRAARAFDPVVSSSKHNLYLGAPGLDWTVLKHVRRLITLIHIRMGRSDTPHELPARAEDLDGSSADHFAMKTISARFGAGIAR